MIRVHTKRNCCRCLQARKDAWLVDSTFLKCLERTIKWQPIHILKLKQKGEQDRRTWKQMLVEEWPTMFGIPVIAGALGMAMYRDFSYNGFY